MTWRNFRLLTPALVMWVLLAIGVALIRGEPDSVHAIGALAIIGTGVGLVIGALVARIMTVARWWAFDWAHRARDTALLSGFMTIASGISLLSRTPLAKPRFGATESFDVGWATDLRRTLVEAASGLPPPGNQLVPGLAVGDTSLLGSTLDADMKTVSLTHLVAVSGANCAIVVAGIVAVVAVCGGGRWMRTLTAALALLAFVIIVGPQPSVIRASVMATILLISLSFGHPARGVPVLGVAIVVLLLVNPEWALDFGFTLSVFATGALLVLAPPLADRLSSWMPHKVAVLVSIPLAAELVCQPIVVLLAPGLPVFGIVANILAEPAAPVATITGLIGAVVLMVSPAVGAVLLWLCWLPAAWIAQVAHVCASLPLSRTVWPGGLIGVLLSILVSVAVTVLLLWPRGRQLALAVLVLTLGVSITTTVMVDSWRQIGTPRDWLIAACDVGQGDALLVRPSATSESIMMIDTGRDENLLRTCLHQLGVTRVALLVLTHYDIDHSGAYSVVLGQVDRAVVGKPIDVSEQAIVNGLSEAGAEVEFGRAGLSGDLGESGFRWRELWPVPGKVGMQSGNPGSLVIRADWAGEPNLSAMFLGDLGEDAQRALVYSAAIRPVTVVKVAHHGSADQSEGLYAKLRALVGLVSVGAENGYGHPTDRALQLLSASGTLVYRTDHHGLLLVRRDDHGLEVWTSR